MARQRTIRRFLSLRRTVIGVLGVLAGLAVAVLNGGFSAVGREIILKSQVIQSGIEVVQHDIERWIAMQQGPNQTAPIRPDELEKLCTKRAMTVMPTEGFPGFIEKKRNCLRTAGDYHAI